MAIDSALGRLGIKQGVCTSSTRPVNPFEGQVIYESDTNRTLVYDNAAWVVVADNQVLSIDAANSRVGIGTTSPAYPLDVSGDINYTGNLKKNGTTVVIPPAGMEYLASGSVATTSQTGYFDLDTTVVVGVNYPAKVFLYVDGTGTLGNEMKFALDYAGFGTLGNTGWCKYTNLSNTETFVVKNLWGGSYSTEYMTMGTTMPSSTDATHIEIDVTSAQFGVMAFSGKFGHSIRSINTTTLVGFEAGHFAYQSTYSGTYGSRFSRIHYNLGSTPSSTVDIKAYVWRYDT